METRLDPEPQALIPLQPDPGRPVGQGLCHIPLHCIDPIQPRERKPLAQGHTEGSWQSQALSSEAGAVTVLQQSWEDSGRKRVS